jgi:hypothetical protein
MHAVITNFWAHVPQTQVLETPVPHDNILNVNIAT